MTASTPGVGPGTRRGRSSDRAHRVRRALVLLAVIVVFLVALDSLRPPQRQVGAAAALAAIDVYQATASRLLGRLGARCRFEPTCSHYGELAIRNRGLLPGSWLIARRIVRCGPWTPSGTIDPAPGALTAPPAPVSASAPRVPGG